MLNFPYFIWYAADFCFSSQLSMNISMSKFSVSYLYKLYINLKFLYLWHIEKIRWCFDIFLRWGHWKNDIFITLWKFVFVVKVLKHFQNFTLDNTFLNFINNFWFEKKTEKNVIEAERSSGFCFQIPLRYWFSFAHCTYMPLAGLIINITFFSYVVEDAINVPAFNEI